MNTEEIKDTGVENEAPLNEEETGAEGNPEEMEELLAAEAEAERRAALNTREAEIEAALNEVTAETSEADRETVEAEAAQFEQDAETLTQEETANTEERAGIEAEIARMQAELEELNQRAKPQAPAPVPPQNVREDERSMNTRTTFFGMTIQERDAFMAREDVTNFLQRVRAMRAEQRAVTGAELGIPKVILGLIRENIDKYSKLKKHVTVRQIAGEGRVLVSGPIPEAVWTGMCETLNELDLSFTQVELEGFKVGGVIYVCNALMKDTDIALATEIINAIGQAIGLALDKAILYGKDFGPEAKENYTAFLKRTRKQICKAQADNKEVIEYMIREKLLDPEALDILLPNVQKLGDAEYLAKVTEYQNAIGGADEEADQRLAQTVAGFLGMQMEN